METKEVQGKRWGTAPAGWARHVEPTFIPMYRAVWRRSYLPNEEKIHTTFGTPESILQGLHTSYRSRLTMLGNDTYYMRNRFTLFITEKI